jgi:hypothetical protein
MAITPFKHLFLLVMFSKIINQNCQQAASELLHHQLIDATLSLSHRQLAEFEL